MCEEGFEEIHSRVFSRVGLLGNPSDGYGGKCISFSLANFSAEVSPCHSRAHALQCTLPCAV